MVGFLSYALFCVFMCLVVTAYVIYSWCRIHRDMRYLCFRVGVIARKSLLSDNYVFTNSLLIFFFGGLQHILDREITRLEFQHSIQTLRLPPTMWPGQQLRNYIQRVDRLERALLFK